MQRPALVADIGGTNARFAMVDLAAPTAELHDVRALATAGFNGLHEAAVRYLSTSAAHPREAALAVASPMTGDDKVPLTNCAWSFSRAALHKALALDRLLVLNDFGAIAHAVPALGPGDRGHVMGPVRDRLAGPVSVLGPGTGLGVALLVGDDDVGWTVVETEGGHIGFAPQCDEEERVARWIASRHRRASIERLLSGSGLSAIDAVLRGAGTGDTALRDPADIVAAALTGDDAVASRVLERFCAVLGGVAGDIALVHGSRTVMVAGGIVPRFLPFLRASAFAERFLDKGRFAGYLSRTAVHVVTHPHPGLLGAAVALRGDVAR